MSNISPDDRPIRVMAGLNGSLELYTDRVILRKTGWLSRLMSVFSGETKSLRLYDIRHVHFDPRAFLNRGMIRLDTGGRQDIVLVFLRRDEADATEMAERIEDLASRMHVNAALLRRTI